MYDVERMQVLHGSSDILRIAHAQFPWQHVGYVMDDVFECATANVLENEVEVFFFGEHDTHEFDHVRVAQIAEHLDE